jgi:hypothetical protein
MGTPVSNSHDTLQTIAGDLIDDMPEVSEHAIAEQQALQERNFGANNVDSGAPMFDGAQTGGISSANPNAWPLDGRGKPYNPATHEVSAATGKAIKKRRGTKSSVATPASPAQNSAPVQNQQIIDAQKAHANGHMAAAATFAALQGIFGEEFKPRKDAELGDEFSYLSGAYGDYFLAKGMNDVPPGLALIIAVGAIAMPRFAMPKTKSKMSRIKDFIIGKFFTWRAKKTVSTAEKNTKEAQLNA